MRGVGPRLDRAGKRPVGWRWRLISQSGLSRARRSRPGGGNLSVDTGLSVLLPVYNAQHGLEPTVSEILDVLPNRDGTFELYLVDDGSTDDTTDQAYELAARYPQVSVIHHPARLGLAEAIGAALVRIRADFIIVAGTVYALEPDDLRTLWQLRELEQRQNRGAKSQSAIRETWLNKWPRLRADTARGLQLIGRSTFEQFRLGEDFERLRRVDSRGTPATPQSGRPNFLRDNERAPREKRGCHAGCHYWTSASSVEPLAQQCKVRARLGHVTVGRRHASRPQLCPVGLLRRLNNARHRLIRFLAGQRAVGKAQSQCEE